MRSNAATGNLKLSLSHAAVPPSATDLVFANNRGPTPVVVLDRSVNMPPTPVPPVPVPWVAPFAVRIHFDNPFVYAGGDLCVEFEGELQSSGPEGWWFDFEKETNTAAVSRFGAGCGAPVAEYVPPAAAQARGLHAGGTATVALAGRVRTIGALVLGSAHTTAWDLSARPGPQPNTERSATRCG